MNLWSPVGVAASVLASLVAIYVLGGALRDVVGRRRQRRIIEAKRIIAKIVLAGDEEAGLAVDELPNIPRRTRLKLLTELVLDFEGDADARVRRLVEVTGLARHITRMARRRNWRYRAQAARLASLIPDVEARGQLLHDRHPLVRAHAAENLDRDDVAGHCSTLLTHLDDPNRAVRFAAQQALLAGDSRIVGDLLSYLQNGDHPGTLWALEVAANTPDPRLMPVFRLHAKSHDERRRAIAAEGAGNVPGAATDLVRELLSDPDAEVRTAAIGSVGRLHAVELAGLVGERLSDPSWVVRREAGLTLEQLAPTGSMVLRQHLSDPDPYARDMARLVLDGMTTRRGQLGVMTAIDLEGLDDWVPA